MIWYVDGGCRGNGYPDAVGAAAAVRRTRYKTWTYRRKLPYDGDRHTNQRAELLAIITALKQSLRVYEELGGRPWLDVTIHSDSRYAVSCMKEWVYKWSRNGYINAAGYAVANQDLIREASDLEDELIELGGVTWKWIPRGDNETADSACREILDEMEEERWMYF
ncbi:hypothetical protein BST61_g10449 [Cercospora zeina]